jgi:hypothetical protein
LYQGVGAHYHTDRPVADLGQGGFAFLCGQASGQQHGFDAQGLKEPGKTLVVLLRQHLSGGHDNGLTAVFYRQVSGGHGHGGLARTHVTLYQPVHGAAALYVACDFGQDPYLRVRRREG